MQFRRAVVPLRRPAARRAPRRPPPRARSSPERRGPATVTFAGHGLRATAWACRSTAPATAPTPARPTAIVQAYYPGTRVGQGRRRIRVRLNADTTRRRRGRSRRTG